MTLDDLLTALRRHRLPAAVVALLVLALGTFGALAPADEYSATTTVIAQPAEEGDVISFSSAVQVLVPTLTAYVESRVNEELVRGSMPPELARADVEVEAEAEPGTGLLYVTATSTDRAAVAPFANAAAFALRTRQADDIAGVRLEVLDEAATPVEPSGPPREAVLLAAVVLAAFAGLVTAIALRALAARAELADVLTSRTGVPVVGELPRLGRRHRALLEPEQLAGGVTDPRITETLQRVRVALDATAGGSRALAVTSLHPGEGKSSVTAALAWTMASAGYSVVVADGDLRRPTQHAHFDVDLVPGLSDADRQDPVRLLRPTLEASLRVLPAGVPDRHPLEVLDSVLADVVSRITAEVALLVVDTPPLASVAETQRILQLVGRALLVVDAPRAHVEDVERAVTRLRASGVEVVGLVVNRSSRGRRQRRDAYHYAPPPTARRPAEDSGLDLVRGAARAAAARPARRGRG